MPSVCILHRVQPMQQPQSWACWYTSYQMVVAYYRSNGNTKHVIDPSEHPYAQALFLLNIGIGNVPDEREKVAKMLGFSTLFASLNTDGLENLLLSGPVIYSGRWPNTSSGHVVVLVGLEDNILYYNNPATGTMVQTDYYQFAGTYLLQTGERCLIY